MIVVGVLRYVHIAIAEVSKCKLFCQLNLVQLIINNLMAI
jgi:hypothetical protein